MQSPGFRSSSVIRESSSTEIREINSPGFQDERSLARSVVGHGDDKQKKPGEKSFTSLRKLYSYKISRSTGRGKEGWMCGKE